MLSVILIQRLTHEWFWLYICACLMRSIKKKQALMRRKLDSRLARKRICIHRKRSIGTCGHDVRYCCCCHDERMPGEVASLLAGRASRLLRNHLPTWSFQTVHIFLLPKPHFLKISWGECLYNSTTIWIPLSRTPSHSAIICKTTYSS